MAKRKTVSVEIDGENGSPPISVEISDVDLKLVDLYLRNGLNGTQAYMTLHPIKKKKGEKNIVIASEAERRWRDSARSSVSDVLAKPNVKAIVADRIKKHAMGVDEIVYHYTKIARSTIHPFIRYMPDGFAYFNLSDPEAQEYLFMIKEYEGKRERRIEGSGEDEEEWEGEWVKVKLYDRMSALNALGKMHKLFVDRVENSGYTVEIPWDDLTPEQIVRLRQGVDPAIIKKEIDDRKSGAK